MYTIASATGGCGKTFYATNLAWFLHHWTGKRVCIVDLDLQFGEVSTALRLRPKYTIFDALQREDADESDLQAHIEEYMVVHDTGVNVLAAPREPSRGRPHHARPTSPASSRPSATASTTSWSTRRRRWPRPCSPPSTCPTCSTCMATLDLPSVRNMSVFLSTLDRLKIDTDNLRLVLNKAEEDVGIDIDQVTKLFPQGFESILPYAKEVSRSINLGMPVMAASPEAEISRLMAGGMKLVLPKDLQERDHRGERTQEDRPAPALQQQVTHHTST